MKDHHEEQGRFRDYQNDLDRMLDAALAKHAAVDPRTGLEDRILANLRAKRVQIEIKIRVRAWWRLGLVTAVAAIIIVTGTIMLKLRRRSQPLVKNPPSVTVPDLRNRETPRLETKKPVTQAANYKSDAVSSQRKPVRDSVTHSNQSEAVAAAYPKLDQFPSPQPLSEQEKLLLQYVRQHPEEALLTAKAQEEFDARIHADLQQATTQTGPSSSDQISDQQKR